MVASSCGPSTLPVPDNNAVELVPSKSPEPPGLLAVTLLSDVGLVSDVIDASTATTV